jgi:hypothetical protein
MIRMNANSIFTSKVECFYVLYVLRISKLNMYLCLYNQKMYN